MEQSKKGSQVVHVRGDSDTDLEALFRVLNNKDGQTPGQIPYSMRKLPASFFKPPEPLRGNHSRDSSTDSTQGSYTQPPSTACPTQLALKHGLQNAVHMRAHSSPASLQQTLLQQQQPAISPQTQHNRQQSLDISEEVPLPPGWEMAKTPTGQRYFLNHLDQQTTWHDPRKSLSTTALNQPSLGPSNLGPLPPGWEQASSRDGETYFINHVEKTTSWFDPRLPIHLQRPNARLHQQLQVPISQQQPNQQQQQQQLSSLQQQLQRMTPAERTRQMQFQKLQIEKERLRKRQDEIERRMMLCTGGIAEEQLMQIATSTAEMTVTSNNVDPFLGHSTGTSDMHTRQESADSGLGGMGYSVPRTPEDFLGNMDESTDGGQKLQPHSQHNAHTDFNMELQGNMDIANIGDGEVSNMDGDDLVPSIQDDISNELLRDVESVLNSTEKMDTDLLAWI